MIVTRTGRLVCAIVAVLLALGHMMHVDAAAAGADGAELRYWTQPQTGLAIGGYDPVAYYTDAAARPGEAGFEASYAGTVWRFANEGNRAVFLANPEVYAPRFGGYSPPAVARSIAVTGNPLIWAIHQNRLYLFHSPVHKTLWEQDRDDILAKARARWPQLRSSLPR